MVLKIYFAFCLCNKLLKNAAIFGLIFAIIAVIFMSFIIGIITAIQGGVIVTIGLMLFGIPIPSALMVGLVIIITGAIFQTFALKGFPSFGGTGLSEYIRELIERFIEFKRFRKRAFDGMFELHKESVKDLPDSEIRELDDKFKANLKKYTFYRGILPISLMLIPYVLSYILIASGEGHPALMLLSLFITFTVAIFFVRTKDIIFCVSCGKYRNFFESKCPACGSEDHFDGMKIITLVQDKKEQEGVKAKRGEKRLEKYDALASKNGGKCLTRGNRGETDFLTWQCSEKHRWNESYENVRQGAWCPQCPDVTVEDMHRLAKKMGGTFLSESFNGMNEKHIWRCKNNHEFWKTPNDVKYRGYWCDTCSHKNKKRRNR